MEFGALFPDPLPSHISLSLSCSVLAIGTTKKELDEPRFESSLEVAFQQDQMNKVRVRPLVVSSTLPAPTLINPFRITVVCLFALAREDVGIKFNSSEGCCSLFFEWE